MLSRKTNTQASSLHNSLDKKKNLNSKWMKETSAVMDVFLPGHCYSSTKVNFPWFTSASDAFKEVYFVFFKLVNWFSYKSANVPKSCLIFSVQIFPSKEKMIMNN